MRVGRCAVVSQDAFYRRDLPAGVSWESAAAFDWEALLAEVARCRACHRAVVVEGFCLLAEPRLAEAEVVVLLECGREEAMRRRLARDAGAGIDDPANTAEYFEKCVWPAHEEYAKRVEGRVHLRVDTEREERRRAAERVAQAVEEAMVKKRET